MIRLRDERKLLIDDPGDISSFRFETQIMDSYSNGKAKQNIPVAKGLDFAHFIAKEVPGVFTNDWCAHSSSEDALFSRSKKACDQVVSESEDEAQPRLMPFIGFSSPRDCPATRALELAFKLDHARRAGMAFATLPPKKMIQQNSLKRSRSSLSSLNVADLIEATQPVEDSINFPSIDWQFDEGEDGDDEAEGAISNLQSPSPVVADDEMLDPPRAKRHCGGLVRSKQVACDLSQLEGFG